MPRCRKGKMQAVPDTEVQEGRSGVSSGQEEYWEEEQSPHLLVTTTLQMALMYIFSFTHKNHFMQTCSMFRPIQNTPVAL